MSEQQLIAVAVDRAGCIVGHAGRALGWQVFECTSGKGPAYAYALVLDEAASFHVWHTRDYPERHPLHQVDVVIAASAGDGVIRKLGDRGVQVVTTTESDPLMAVQLFLAGTLPEGLPHGEHDCDGEGHQHE